MDLREGEALVLHPLFDLFFVREERQPFRRRRAGETGVELRDDLCRDRLEITLALRGKAFPGGKAEVPLHRVPAHARRPDDRPDPVALLTSSQDIHNVDHHILLSRHTSSRSVIYLPGEYGPTLFRWRTLAGGSIDTKNSTRDGSKILKRGWVRDLEKSGP